MVVRDERAPPLLRRWEGPIRSSNVAVGVKPACCSDDEGDNINDGCCWDRLDDGGDPTSILYTQGRKQNKKPKMEGGVSMPRSRLSDFARSLSVSVEQQSIKNPRAIVCAGRQSQNFFWKEHLYRRNICLGSYTTHVITKKVYRDVNQAADRLKKRQTKKGMFEPSRLALATS